MRILLAILLAATFCSGAPAQPPGTGLPAEAKRAPALTDADFERAERDRDQGPRGTFLEAIGKRLGIDAKEPGGVELFHAGDGTDPQRGVSGTIDRGGAHLNLKW